MFYSLKKPFVVNAFYAIDKRGIPVYTSRSGLTSAYVMVEEGVCPGIRKDVNIIKFLREYYKYDFKSDEFFIFDGHGITNTMYREYYKIGELEEISDKWINFRQYGGTHPRNKTLLDKLIARDTLDEFPGIYVTEKEALFFLPLKWGAIAYSENVEDIYYGNGTTLEKNENGFILVPYGDDRIELDTKFGYLILFKDFKYYRLISEDCDIGSWGNLKFIKCDKDAEYLDERIKNFGIWVEHKFSYKFNKYVYKIMVEDKIDPFITQ